MSTENIPIMWSKKVRVMVHILDNEIESLIIHLSEIDDGNDSCNEM